VSFSMAVVSPFLFTAAICRRVVINPHSLCGNRPAASRSLGCRHRPIENRLTPASPIFSRQALYARTLHLALAGRGGAGGSTFLGGDRRGRGQDPPLLPAPERPHA